MGTPAMVLRGAYYGLFRGVRSRGFVVQFAACIPDVNNAICGMVQLICRIVTVSSCMAVELSRDRTL